MKWKLEAIGAGDALIQTANQDPRQIAVTLIGNALPCQAVFKIIDQARAQYGGVANGHAFAQIHLGIFRNTTRQERGALCSDVVAPATAPEDGLVTVGRNFVVDTADQGVVPLGLSGSETKTLKVEGIADGVVIGRERPEGALEIGQHG